MKIILVRSPFIDIMTGMPIGLAYLQHVLKDAGHEVSIIDFSISVNQHFNFSSKQFNRNFELNKDHPAYDYAYRQIDSYCQEISKRNPDVVGFHLSYSTVDFACKMAEKLRVTNVRLIAGGPEATHRAEYLQNLEIFDAIVQGYGEEAVLCAIRKIIGIIEAPLIKNKDYRPDFTGVEHENYDGRIPIVTTRGCPRKCTFCTQHFPYFYHSIESVVDQIENAPPDCGIILNDSNLNFNPKRTRKLFEAIGQVIGERHVHAFGLEISPHFENYIEQFALCRIVEARVGIESGSPSVRKAMNKHSFKNLDVRRMVQAMTSCGSTVWAQFILCYPSETDDDRKQTLELMHQISQENPEGLVKIFWYRFVVHHGTEDYFKERFRITAPEGIRDWISPCHTKDHVMEIAERMRPKLPDNAVVYL
jgi:radical SAM superfamily enzyme YgiQ (UPF0313 family)